MRILVTGATGFVGSRLALMRATSGHDLIATGRLQSDDEFFRANELRTAGIDLKAGSLQEDDFTRDIVRNCDAVIHLAAAQHEANVPEQHFHQVNVENTRRLIERSIAAGVRRFVYGSTIGIYGSARDGSLDENSAPGADNAYGRTKLAAEAVVRDSAERIETCIVRISEVYGGGDFRLLKLFRAIDKGVFMMIGPGTNLRQVIYVEDLCRGLLMAATEPMAVGQTFVLAGQEVMTTREMVETIAEILGKPLKRVSLPMSPFVLAAALFELTCRPLGMQPPIHRRRLDFFRKSFTFSTQHSARVLGFSSRVQFAEGVREAVQWYRSKGLL